MLISFFRIVLLFYSLALLAGQQLLGQDGYYTSYQVALHQPNDVETLDLSHEKPGDELYLFRELRTLILRNGQIDSINDSIIHLTELEEITIVSSNLRYVSPYLFSLPNLRVINLSQNQLTTISFEYNQKIEFLDFSYNNLTNVDSIHFCENLQILKLRGNDLELFEPRKQFWQKIRGLDLSENVVGKVGTAIAYAKDMEYVNLRHNQLTHCPAGLHLLPKLARLDLAGNLITAIPTNWLKAEALHRLDISGNPLECQQTVLFSQLKHLLRSKCLCTNCAFESQHPDFSIYPRNP